LIRFNVKLVFKWNNWNFLLCQVPVCESVPPMKRGIVKAA
jgi:hypothetical protein